MNPITGSITSAANPISIGIDETPARPGRTGFLLLVGDADPALVEPEPAPGDHRDDMTAAVHDTTIVATIELQFPLKTWQ